MNLVFRGVLIGFGLSVGGAAGAAVVAAATSS